MENVYVNLASQKSDSNASVMELKLEIFVINALINQTQDLCKEQTHANVKISTHKSEDFV